MLAIYFFAYYETVFHSVTNNKMKLNDIHATFVWIEQYKMQAVNRICSTF